MDSIDLEEWCPHGNCDMGDDFPFWYFMKISPFSNNRNWLRRGRYMPDGYLDMVKCE